VEKKYLSKAEGMAKVSAKGSFHLLWGLVVSTIISAVGTVLIARLLAPSEYGIFTIALTAPSLIAIFRDWGVSSAIVKYGAQYKAEGKSDNVRSILIAALIFETLTGIILFVISFVISGFLATTVYNRPQISSLLQISSSIILTGAILPAAQGAFTGIERMELNSLTMIVQSILKTTLVSAFVIIGMGAFGAITGYAISSLLSAIASLFLLRMIYRLHVKSPEYKLDIIENIKTLLRYGLPLSGYLILGALLPQFYNILLPIYSSDTLIGNYSVASNFVVLISFFAMPITTVMFPAFSKLNAQIDKETLRNVYKFSVKYASLLVVPVAFMVMALSEPAVSTLFGDKYIYAPLFLSLLALGYLATATGSLSNGNLINGQGQTKFMLKMSLLMAAIGFPLGLIMVSHFGIIGIIVATDTVGIPCTVIELYWINKNYGVSVDFRSSAKIVLSSAIAAIVTFSFVFFSGFNSILTLFFGTLIFLAILIIALSATKTLTIIDVYNFREMTKSIQHLRGTINVILRILEKVINTFNPTEKSP
jgi:stage V sporulation protein B